MTAISYEFYTNNAARKRTQSLPLTISMANTDAVDSVTTTRKRCVASGYQSWELASVTVGLAVVAVFLLWTVFRAAMFAPVTTGGVRGHTKFVRVHTGDTLWRIAERYGNSDEYVLARLDDIRTLNHLADGDALQPGQVVVVSAGENAHREFASHKVHLASRF